MAYREDNFYEGLVGREDQIKIKGDRGKSFVQRSVSNKEFSGTGDDGWRISKEGKKTTLLIKDKRKDALFEDKIWCLLQSMSFEYMSSDKDFKIQYGDKSETQQIDVFAMNEDVAIIVECKSSSDHANVKTRCFKKDIESMNSQRMAITKLIKGATSKNNLTVVFAFAFENIKPNNADKDRMKKHGIKCFSVDDVEYYSRLVKELGDVARYQFQADLLVDKKIASINNEVFAIKSKVGKRVCYTFSIEPDRLLKLGYILHHKRNDNNETTTYQRILKKSRLKSIRKFVQQGGYFPNSLIVNINSGKKDLKFKPSSPKDLVGSQTKIGILELPQKYKSIYIIDGQHRLYSYADSKSSLAKNVTVPVVAFVDLDGDEQLDMFMSINQNQKSVSASLRITLEADLKFGSSNLADAAVGLRNRVAIDLGEKESSPLFGRIPIGEEQSIRMKTVTLKSICNGLDKTNFIGKFTEFNAVRGKFGYFYDNDHKKQLKNIYDFLCKYFHFIKENCAEEWKKLHNEKLEYDINKAIICSPNGIAGLIITLNGIVKHVKKHNEEIANNELYERSLDYFKTLTNSINKINLDDRKYLRDQKGSNGPDVYSGFFNVAINRIHPDYKPVNIKDHQEAIENDCATMILEIEKFFLKNVNEAILSMKNDPNYTETDPLMQAADISFLPKSLIEKIRKDKKAAKALNEKPSSFRFTNYLYFIDYRTIFEKRDIPDPKLRNTKWESQLMRFRNPHEKDNNKYYYYLKDLNEIRSKAFHSNDEIVTMEDLSFIRGIKEWIFKQEPPSLYEKNS